VQTDSSQAEEIIWFDEIAAADFERIQPYQASSSRYAQKFMTFLSRSGLNDQDADDIVALFFEKLIKQKGKLKLINHPRGYLWRMLRNTMIDYIHSNRVQPAARAQELDFDITDESSTFEDIDFVDCRGGDIWGVQRYFSRQSKSHSTGGAFRIVRKRACFSPGQVSRSGSRVSLSGA